MPAPLRSRKHLPHTLLLGLAAGCAPLCAQPLTWSGHVGAVSQWLVRGQRVSDGDAPVLIAGADAYARSGWSLGVAALLLRDRDGDAGDGWSLHAGHELALDERWRALVDLQYVGYEGSPALAAWRGPRAALGVADGDRWSLSWNVDRPQNETLAAQSVDFNLRWPLTSQFSAGAGFGAIVRSRGTHYRYGQAGLAWRQDGWQLQLDRTWGPPGVGPSTGPGYGRPPTPRARWVAGAQWTF